MGNKRHPKPERGDQFDQILRHASRHFPSEVARVLLCTDQPIEPLEWAETQVTGRQRRLDRALSLKVAGERTLLHAEWTLRMTQRVPFRVFEYHNLTALALADEVRARIRTKPPPIESVVVVLSGRKKPWPSHGEYRTSPLGKPFSGVQFRIEPVYQRTVAELSTRGPFWMIFASLAADADATKLAQVLGELRAQTSPEAFEELGAAMAVLAGADRRERGFGDVVRSLLPRELVMENWIFKEGKAEGLKTGRKQGLAKGLQPLVHQFERRLARPLTPDERARLAKRLRAHGPEKLGDVVLDLSPAELSAWLAPSNGHGT
jgi:hypothetical protein